MHKNNAKGVVVGPFGERIWSKALGTHVVSIVVGDVEELLVFAISGHNGQFMLMTVNK